MSTSKFSNVCCICNQPFQSGQHKLECSKCNSPAHRTCLPKMTSGAFARLKSMWTCSKRCEDANEEEDETTSEDADDDYKESYQTPVKNSLNSALKKISSLSLHEKSLPSPSTSKKKSSKCFKFAHLNVNGIKGKFPQICEFLSDETKIVVLAITESKLHESIDELDYKIPSFSVKRIDRPYGQRGGGQLVYFHASCKYKIVDLPADSPPPGLVECNVFRVTKAGMFTALVCVIYAPPRDVRNSFLDYFAKICQFLTSKKAVVIIMGDFNIDWLEESYYRRKLQGVLSEYELVQMVQSPTREGALLDHVYVSKGDITNFECTVMPDASTSDHDLTLLSFQ